MAVTNTAVFPQSVQLATAATSSANANLADNTAEPVLLATFGLDGGELTSLTVIPRATSTATVAYLYVSTDSGTTKRLVKAVLVPADTVSTTDAPTQIDFGFTETSPFRGGAATRLYVGTSVALAAGFSWIAQYRNF